MSSLSGSAQIHNKKKRIGVFGAASHYTKEQETKAIVLGRAIAENGCILVCGATSGLSHAASVECQKNGGFVIGVSPAANALEHTTRFGMPTDFSVIIYTGLGKKGRNLLNIANSDICTFIGGEIGTLNEFTIACDEGKPIGVLESGGITSILPQIVDICKRKLVQKIIFEKDPAILIQKLLLG